MLNKQAYIKAEQIARFIVQGVSKAKIAVTMGMSYSGLCKILETDEYLQLEADVRKNVLGQMDARLVARLDTRKRMADEMEDEAVPEAWRIALENLKKKRDLKTALEILDRDPQRQFSKSASAAAHSQAPTSIVSAPTRPPIDSNVLAKAVKEADVTHQLLNAAEKIQPGRT